MRQSERLSRIVEQLSADGSVGVGDLAGELGVSPATVRRDLALLDHQRLLARTHGGAVAHGVLYELPLRYRSARRQEQKARIARAAAELVPEGAAVGMTGGTTTTEAGTRAVRPPPADGRHQLAEHRLRAGRPPQPEARGDRRGRPRPVVRAGRPDG